MGVSGVSENRLWTPTPLPPALTSRSSVGRPVRKVLLTGLSFEDRVVRNGLACMRCHDKGMKRFTDVIRPSLERLGASIAFDYQRALELYPPKDEMDRLLDQDGDTFMNAMKEALGHEQTREPLAIVSRRFLEEPVSLTRATGGQLQRDAWNDVFDEVVRQVGAAVPIVANRSDRRMFIELIGTDADGLKVIFTKPGTTRRSRTYATARVLAG